jgi:hypothetical protein
MRFEQIKARIMTNWTPETTPRAKFYPGDYAIPTYISGDSGIREKRIGHIGKVIAVTTTGNYKIRGNPYDRAYSIYYLQFDDGEIFGFLGGNLKKTSGPSKDNPILYKHNKNSTFEKQKEMGMLTQVIQLELIDLVTTGLACFNDML